MALRKGGARRSQLITTYGVGAVIALEDESFMVAGLDEWPVAGPPDLQEKRLAQKLGLEGFRRPPATGKIGKQDVPIVRFPRMYFCPGECSGLLQEHRRFAAPEKNKCNECNTILVPSRFVTVCEQGHIDDFPFWWWVHLGKPHDQNKPSRLTITTTGASASLSAVKISCKCGAERSMEGSFNKNALKGFKCGGYHPHLGTHEECSCTPRTLQRGASNVYFSVVESAISIPPWSEGVFKILDNYWAALRACPDVALAAMVEGMGLAQGTAYTAKDLADAVRSRKVGEAEGHNPDKDLKEEEYEALCVGKQERSREQDFVCVPSPGAEDAVGAYFEQVMLVTRLREVMALRGFTRLLPLTGTIEDAARIGPLAKETKNWLPAMEVRGEGVFLRLNDNALKHWEKRSDVQARAKRIDDNLKRRFAQYGLSAPFKVGPRLVMIHTLAHVLINQWSLDCGYPAGSLRERLYVTEPDAEKPMAGLLIYTATSDAAGSLGGVTALGEGERLGPALQEAMGAASWCSADPLCVEADAAGTDSLNLAACHACVLLPEVSCERSNGLLDRGLLIGTLDQPDLGFFSPLARGN